MKSILLNEIHCNHIFDIENETIADIIDHFNRDVWGWYLVHEYVSNFSKVHLISESSPEEATMKIMEMEDTDISMGMEVQIIDSITLINNEISLNF